MNENRKVTEIFFPEGRLAALMGMRGLNEKVQIAGRVIAILKNKVTGEERRIHGVNIVTNEGDKYYGQRGAVETPTIAFNTLGGLRLGTNATAPIKANSDVGTFLAGSGHTIKATYPKTADPDTDNTGAGVDIITWTYEYLTTEGNGVNIAEGAVVNHITTPTAALSHFLFAALFTKTTNDTLKVVINHQMNGI